MTAAATADTAPAIALRGMRLREGDAPFDLDLPAGTILGVSGLEGHGQQLLLEALCGQARAFAGAVAIEGEELPGPGPRSAREAFGRGIVYVPRDRKTEGIFPTLSVLENFAVATLARNSRLGVLDRGAIKRRYAEFAAELGIVTDGPGAPIRSLSGGNQQKVLLARWLAAAPKVLLLNDPSRGVDHRTRLQLYSLYRRVADEGAAVVLLSTEIEELLAAADEIVVFREHTISGRLRREDAGRDGVLAAMFGVPEEAARA
ncbi:MAG TPA: ATP-binding cassette domain-containing protein [Solirubrobacterales bacterium]|nr:ATP-binding cassette domain-containing protein [Solirubrobacterales bacterium]